VRLAVSCFRRPYIGMSSAIPDPTRRREKWLADRDRFIILLHLYNIRDFESPTSLTAERLMRDLGFAADRTEHLVRSLIFSEFLEYSGHGQGLDLTRAAIKYIEKEAGRRRSVRLLP
jgi:hypothetical protein